MKINGLLTTSLIALGLLLYLQTNSEPLILEDHLTNEGPTSPLEPPEKTIRINSERKTSHETRNDHQPLTGVDSSVSRTIISIPKTTAKPRAEALGRRRKAYRSAKNTPVTSKPGLKNHLPKLHQLTASHQIDDEHSFTTLTGEGQSPTGVAVNFKAMDIELTHELNDLLLQMNFPSKKRIQR